MIALDHRLIFPDPLKAPDHGFLAIGGDLSIERLLLAYHSGIFPWYNEDDPIYWWSPDPRMVFDLHCDMPLRITKSMRQSRRNRGYEVLFNVAFEEVIRQCKNVPRPGQEGTWLNTEMVNAYIMLHELGYAKSVAVYQNGDLVGGLYGIDLPDQKIFCGESMFSKQRDASKIALWWLVDYLKSAGYRLIDGQVYNDHLANLGAVEIPREEFIKQLQI